MASMEDSCGHHRWVMAVSQPQVWLMASDDLVMDDLGLVVLHLLKVVRRHQDVRRLDGQNSLLGNTFRKPD